MELFAIFALLYIGWEIHSVAVQLQTKNKLEAMRLQKELEEKGLSEDEINTLQKRPLPK